MGRGDLSDEQWRRLAPLLPAQKPPTGRPAKDHRTIINGIPRFHGGRPVGAADRRSLAGPARTVRPVAHRGQPVLSLPGQKGGGRPGAGPFPGRIRDENPPEGRRPWQAGGLCSDTGPEARSRSLREVDVPGGGETKWCRRPRTRPERVCGAKGYSSGKIRSYLRRRRIRLSIPRKRNEKRRGPFDREIYRRRNVVERAINRLKRFRQIATRYEKEARNYLAMLQIAAILLWL